MFIPNAVRRFIRRHSTADGGLSDASFRSMVEQGTDVICHIVDRSFTYVSPSAQGVFGWDIKQMIGIDAFSPIFPPDIPMIKDVFAQILLSEDKLSRHQVRVVCGDGSIRWVETSVNFELGKDDKPRTVLVVRDISDRKQLEEELAALALQDGLTGLANRRSFDQMLDQSWRETLREGGEMALLLLDIDYFKQFNDSQGHQAGDDCLRTVAQCVSQYARRPSDMACRYGGEEFAVILGKTEPAAAIHIAEEIRSSIAALGVPHETSMCSRYLTVSVGVATAVARLGGSIRMPESLLQAADHALYKAKEGGRNRVETSILIAPSERM
jgi:diguanylate cyclase (GGDEF)-like protein/PAS domain S-box-containing protein